MAGFGLETFRRISSPGFMQLVTVMSPKHNLPPLSNVLRASGSSALGCYFIRLSLAVTILVYATLPLRAQPGLQMVFLDGVTGQSGPDTVVTGQVVEFYLRATNITVDGDCLRAFYNAFRVYSPDSAKWMNLSGQFSAAVDSSTFSTFTVGHFGADGSSSDTVEFHAVVGNNTCGLPPDFDSTLFVLRIGPIAPIYHGLTIVIDTVTSIATWDWLWSYGCCDVIKGQVRPEWGGPYVFTIVDTTGTSVNDDSGLSKSGIAGLLVSPNPLNAETEIVFGLPSRALVRLEIFDALGRSIETLVDEVLSSGYHRFTWRTEGSLLRPRVPSGVYFLRISTTKGTQTAKLTVLK